MPPANPWTTIHPTLPICGKYSRCTSAHRLDVYLFHTRHSLTRRTCGSAGEGVACNEFLLASNEIFACRKPRSVVSLLRLWVQAHFPVCFRFCGCTIWRILAPCRM